MSAITIEDGEAKLRALTDELIQQLRVQAIPPRVLKVGGVEITLQPGERYAGAVLDIDGCVKHHVILMATRPAEDLEWQVAMDWAEEVGGSLPDRQEQALLYANCKPHLKPVWHWSCVQHETNASFAWGCGFYFGHQGYGHKGFEGAAVAVRRVNP